MLRNPAINRKVIEMGKTATYGNRMFYKNLVTQIRCGKAVQDVSTQELARLVGIPASTLYNRIQHPEGFRLDELLGISRALGIEVDVKSKLL